MARQAKYWICGDKDDLHVKSNGGGDAAIAVLGNLAPHLV